MDNTEIFTQYIKNLAVNTERQFNHYVGQQIREKTYTQQQAQADAHRLVESSLDYLDALLDSGLIDEQGLGRIIARISKHLDTIKFLPESERGIYGRSEADNKIIYINPDLTDDKQTLYLFFSRTHALLL